MCFYSECDWYADVELISDLRSGSQVQCSECGSVIRPHQRRRHIELIESECCKECEEYEDRCDCRGGPDYGESYTANQCRGCCALLAAIRRDERDEGCPRHAQQPLYGELWETINEHQSAETYVNRALRLFPSLKDHPIIRQREAEALEA